MAGVWTAMRAVKNDGPVAHSLMCDTGAVGGLNTSAQSVNNMWVPEYSKSPPRRQLLPRVVFMCHTLTPNERFTVEVPGAGKSGK